MIHALKIYPEYFDEVRKGNKRFELRKNDRNFRVGDCLALNEWDGERYTGRWILAKVNYMMNPNDVMTCQGGYVLMSIDLIGNHEWEVENDYYDMGRPRHRLPAADVTPAKHCKWTCTDESAGVYRCSYCDGDFLILEGTPDDNSINYCPYCGAKLIE